MVFRYWNDNLPVLCQHILAFAIPHMLVGSKMILVKSYRTPVVKKISERR
jgi:hypothetical protein